MWDKKKRNAQHTNFEVQQNDIPANMRNRIFIKIPLTHAVFNWII